MATIKGVWVLNESLELELEFMPKVNFSIPQGVRDELGNYWSRFDHLYVWQSGIYYYNSGWLLCPVYTSGTWGKDMTYARIVNFGSVEQWVSDGFYEWLMANAMPAPFKISGKWRFKDILTPYWSEESLFTHITFTAVVDSIKRAFIGLVLKRVEDSLNLVYLEHYSNDANWGGQEVYGGAGERADKWNSICTQDIDFGETEQEVSAEFYAWLTANATNQGKPLAFSSPSRFTLATYNAAKNWDGVLEYSTDATSWSVWDGTTTLSADSGKLYLRGTGNTRMASSGTPYTIHRWVLSGTDISCNGNVEDLLDYATVAKGKHPAMAEGCFNYLFYGCKNLISAPALPATVLSNRCYFNLFFRTGLKVAPELPATRVSFQCYFGMFESCENLIVPPALPATTLAAECYKHMFQYCTSLTKIPKLPATRLKQDCYAYMFRGCTSMKLSTTPTVVYKRAFRIPTSGTATSATNALLSMFDNTGGTFSGTPSINTTYYLYEESEYTLITYDGVTVEMDGELPATLECEGKKARTDIVVIPAFPVKIAYGNIVHTADEGTPATLVCSGKKMRADVVITSDITTNFILADGSMLITSDGQIFETQ